MPTPHMPSTKVMFMLTLTPKRSRCWNRSVIRFAMSWQREIRAQPTRRCTRSYTPLEDVPELAKATALSEADQTEVGVAVESLLNAYDKLDAKLHAKDEVKYDSASADVDAAFATLKKYETSAK